MTARELRNRRRAEERKIRKSQTKQLNSLTVAQSQFPSHHDLGVSPETLEEFGPEFIAQANAIRELVHGDAAQHLAAPSAAPTNPGRSTGPRSPMGKATSSRNSLKHGLASGALMIPGEDPAAFDALLADLTADHDPVNCTEQLLVREMAQSYWLMQRATRLQNACFSGSEVDCKQLALFLRYRTTYERAFHKCLNTLIQLRKVRECAGREFVSQKTPKPAGPAGFVSQKAPETPRPIEFVRQNDAPGDHQINSFALSRR